MALSSQDPTPGAPTSEALHRMECLGFLAGALAHDFNNLLAGIMGHSGLAMLALPDNAPAHGDLRKIEDICQQAAERCEWLMVFSGHRQTIQQVTPLSLNPLIAQSLPFLRLPIPSGRTLHFSPASPLPPVMAEPIRMRHLLLGLVLHFTRSPGLPLGNIVITTDLVDPAPSVRTGCPGGGNLPAGPCVSLRLTLETNEPPKDTPPGFSTPPTALIQIIKDHSGAFLSEDRSASGPSISLFFPPAAETPPPPVAAPPLPSRTTPQPAPPARGILIAEDEPGIRALACKILSREGYSLFPASDGREALEVYQKQNASIHLVLLDLGLPGIDGRQVMREIRRSNPHVPILVMSGLGENELSSHLEDGQATAFIQKPFHVSDLLAKIRSCNV
jgi:two-component system, cell cycle sensor histidine kinase and response regulator CckA